ncbi:MAG: glycosyltransferase, partial [Planctomycetaceae bacterium]|nr:glycosyltransferase [Planctomycetaceae bacterium]
MTNPKVTVIIPVYNTELYLRECLESVVNQTFVELQVICVNDGSTDGSFLILQEYASRDDRFLLINLPNGGVSIARNTACEYARGEYILFIDSDDFIDLDAVRQLYARAKETGADVVQFDVQICYNKSHIIKRHYQNVEQGT